jgi:hypothetical protein
LSGVVIDTDDAVDLTLRYIAELDAIASQVGFVVRDVFISRRNEAAGSPR